jgi:integrase
MLTDDSAQHLAIMQARNKAFRWPKGTSGRTPLARCYHQAREIARRSSPEMMERLIELARTSEDHRVVSICAMAILDRAGVKPIDFDPAEEAANRKPKFDPSLYTTEELERIYEILEMMAERQETLPPKE